jgi:protease I
MKKTLLFILIIAILIIGVIVYQNLIKKEEKISSFEKNMMINLQDKKIAMLVAFRGFRDEEYFVTKEVLENSGAEIKTVSTERGTAIGADGGETQIDTILDELKVSDFDAIVFIGGPKTLDYLDNETSYRIAKETISENKVLGAICISPIILAKAGVLSGKKATVWSSVLDKSPVKVLEENGAIYRGNAVVIDGKIITANGPGAAKDFGKTILSLIK